MSASEPPALLLVEDDPVLGPLVASLLDDEYSVELAADGQQGLHLALTRSWAVLVVDRGLPVLDGVALVRALRRSGISTPVLMLTARGETSDKVDGLDAGANDYVTKPFDADELHARLRALTRSYAHPASAVVGIGEWELDTASRTVRSPYGEPVFLTAKESELLAALARDPDHVFTRDELLEMLFHSSDGASVIDTYVHYLRRKLFRSMIRTVHGVGYQIGNPSA